MAGSYVTTSRNRSNPRQEKVLPYSSSGFFFGTSSQRAWLKGATSAIQYLPENPQAVCTQTTTSYRSVGSPLGPSMDEYVLSLAKPSVDGFVKEDTGHTFSTERNYQTTSHPGYGKTFSNGAGFYGPLYNSRHSSYPAEAYALPALPAFDVGIMGRRLIASAAPTVPSSNLLTLGAELLREGINLPGKALVLSLRDRTKLLKSIGSEYLNIEFGWLPLVSDIRDIAKSVLHMTSIIKSFEENSGRWVHRRRSIPVARTAETYGSTVRSRLYLNGQILDVSGGTGKDLWQTVPNNGGSLTQIVKTTSDGIWFSGAFSYYLNPGSDLSGKIDRYSQLANQLLGLRLTPEVLYELTPWSWLVDYFADIGKAVKLYSLFENDGLVMRYGYLMRKSSQQNIRTTEFPPFKDGTRLTLTSTLIRETKNRYKATPFGFGLNPSGFSARQWAILAALGLTKAPNSLP